MSDTKGLKRPGATSQDDSGSHDKRQRQNEDGQPADTGAGDADEILYDQADLNAALSNLNESTRKAFDALVNKASSDDIKILMRSVLVYRYKILQVQHAAIADGKMAETAMGQEKQLMKQLNKAETKYENAEASEEARKRFADTLNVCFEPIPARLLKKLFDPIALLDDFQEKGKGAYTDHMKATLTGYPTDNKIKTSDANLVLKLHVLRNNVQLVHVARAASLGRTVTKTSPTLIALRHSPIIHSCTEAEFEAKCTQLQNAFNAWRSVTACVEIAIERFKSMYGEDESNALEVRINKDHPDPSVTARAQEAMENDIPYDQDDLDAALSNLKVSTRNAFKSLVEKADSEHLRILMRKVLVCRYKILENQHASITSGEENKKKWLERQLSAAESKYENAQTSAAERTSFKDVLKGCFELIPMYLVNAKLDKIILPDGVKEKFVDPSSVHLDDYAEGSKLKNWEAQMLLKMYVHRNNAAWAYFHWAARLGLPLLKSGPGKKTAVPEGYDGTKEQFDKEYMEFTHAFKPLKTSTGYVTAVTERYKSMYGEEETESLIRKINEICPEPTEADCKILKNEETEKRRLKKIYIQHTSDLEAYLEKRTALGITTPPGSLNKDSITSTKDEVLHKVKDERLQQELIQLQQKAGLSLEALGVRKRVFKKEYGDDKCKQVFLELMKEFPHPQSTSEYVQSVQINTDNSDWKADDFPTLEGNVQNEAAETTAKLYIKFNNVMVEHWAAQYALAILQPRNKNVVGAKPDEASQTAYNALQDNERRLNSLKNSVRDEYGKARSQLNKNKSLSSELMEKLDDWLRKNHPRPSPHRLFADILAEGKDDLDDDE